MKYILISHDHNMICTHTFGAAFIRVLFIQDTGIRKGLKFMSQTRNKNTTTYEYTTTFLMTPSTPEISIFFSRFTPPSQMSISIFQPFKHGKCIHSMEKKKNKIIPMNLMVFLSN